MDFNLMLLIFLLFIGLVLVLILSIVLHELGHYLAYRRLGVKPELFIVGRERIKALFALTDIGFTRKMFGLWIVFYPYGKYAVKES